MANQGQPLVRALHVCIRKQEIAGNAKIDARAWHSFPLKMLGELVDALSSILLCMRHTWDGPKMGWAAGYIASDSSYAYRKLKKQYFVEGGSIGS